MLGSRSLESLVVSASIALSACATASVDVGYLAPIDNDEADDKWLVEARAATGGLVKVGVAARSRLGEKHDQIAFAPEVTVEMTARPLALGARLGVHLLHLDHEEDDWTWGAGNVYLQPLLQYRVGDPVWFFIGATLEYQLNSNEGPDAFYAGGQLGLGFDL